MNDILKNYTQEEIEQLAIMAINNNEIEESVPLKIEKIDKEYKKHNNKAVTKAIFNASIIILGSYILLTTDSNVSRFSMEEINVLFEKLIELVSYLPKSELLVETYTMTFDKLSMLIEKLGIVGMLLFSKSISFILTTIKDSKKSIKIKKELSELKEILDKNDKKIK